MGWRDLILNNFWWKLSSLILAAGVWYHYKSADSDSQVAPTLFPGSRIFVGMPVEILKGAQDLRNFRVTPEEVDVTVSGEYQTIKNLSSTNVRVFVAVTGMLTNIVTTNRVQIKSIPGVKLEKSIPEAVRLELLEAGSKVEYRGPDGQLHRTNVFEFERLPIRVMLPDGNKKTYQLIPNQVNVQLSGDAAVLEKVSAKDILAFVDMAGAESGKTNFPVQVHAPEGLKLERTTPKAVRASVIE